MTLNETQVFNAVRRHLQDIEATVLQLVPPGGQAPLGITMETPRGRKTCFPDLIFFKNEVLLVGEMKARYSKSDHEKVAAIMRYGDSELSALFRRHHPLATVNRTMGLLCHSQQPHPETNDVGQWVFGEDLAMVDVVNAPF